MTAANESRAKHLAKYGGRFMVTLLPGDGIGPEMMGYVKQMFQYANHQLIQYV